MLNIFLTRISITKSTSVSQQQTMETIKPTPQIYIQLTTYPQQNYTIQYSSIILVLYTLM